MSQLARQLIAENKRLAENQDPKAKSLDLGNCGLTDLEKEVPELFDCVWLERLNLGHSYLDFDSFNWENWTLDEFKTIEKFTFNEGEKNIISHIPYIIGRLQNLKELYLDHYSDEIQNLISITQLFRLECLTFWSNKIDNVNFLRNLAKLRVLVFSSNQPIDISILQSINQLRFVVITESKKVRNWQVIKDLSQLELLVLSENQLSNISFLEKLTKLKVLALSDNQIIDIKPLKNIQDLHFLDISYNQITDFNSLQRFRNLHTLDVSKNPITDYSFLQKLPNLKELELCKNQLSDIHFLDDLQMLQKLGLSGNKISDYSLLEKLPRIESLDLRGNQIADIHFLQKLQNLNTLDLSDNKIEYIRFLENLQNLHTLDLSNNKISDISPLLFLIQKGILVSLEQLDFEDKKIKLFGNPITTPPIEIVKEGNQAILNYFKELEEGEEAVYEAKLLIIGEAGAGKTSLKRKIGDCEATLPDEEKDTTTGIEITEHTFDATTNLPRIYDEHLGLWRAGSLSCHPPIFPLQTLPLCIGGRRTQRGQQQLLDANPRTLWTG